MSLELKPAILKKAKIEYSQSDYYSEWLVVKTELQFENRTIVADLLGREVHNLVSAVLGHEPEDRIANILWLCRDKPVGVCVEQISDNPPRLAIRSFFHINEADAAAIPQSKHPSRRRKKQ